MSCTGKVHDPKAHLSAHLTLLFGDFDPIVCDDRWFVALVKDMALLHIGQAARSDVDFAWSRLGRKRTAAAFASKVRQTSGLKSVCSPIPGLVLLTFFIYEEESLA